MPILNPNNLRIRSPRPGSAADIVIPNFRRRIADLPQQQFARELDRTLVEIIDALKALSEIVTEIQISNGSPSGGLPPPVSGEFVSGTFDGIGMAAGSVICFRRLDEAPEDDPLWVFPADASRVDSIAAGFCTRYYPGANGGRGPLAYWKFVAAGKILLADGTFIMAGTPLYLSATEPGKLTANAFETDALFHQQCATFHSHRIPGVPFWNYDSGYAAINIVPKDSLPASA